MPLQRLTGLTSAVEAVRFDINEAVVVGGSRLIVLAIVIRGWPEA